MTCGTTSPSALQEPDEAGCYDLWAPDGGRLRDAGAVAIIDRPAGIERRWTYASLEDSVQHATDELQRTVRPGDRVGIVSRNRVEVLIAVLSAWRSGAIAVPLNYRLGAGGIREALADAAPKVVFHEGPLGDLATPSSVYRGLETLSGGERGGNPSVNRSGTIQQASPCLILYTSGSGGRPKGVELSAGSVRWSLEHLGTDLTPAARSLVAAPLGHMNGLYNTLAVLRRQGLVILLSEFSTTEYSTALARHGCTLLSGVPSMMELLLNEGAIGGETGASVEYVKLGSERVSESLIRRTRSAFPKATIGVGFGSTEVGPVFRGRGAGRTTPGALGDPLPGVEIRLVDDDGAQADQGTMTIRTPAMMRGYWGRPEATSRVLSRDGWYASKDILRRDADSVYHFVGRADDMFTCGGENVYPSAVEQILLRHPAVRQACVVPVPDALKGSKPVAFVTLEPEAEVSASEIRAHALREGAAYSHPRVVYVVDVLPCTASGKIDRRQLASVATAAKIHHPTCSATRRSTRPRTVGSREDYTCTCRHT